MKKRNAPAGKAGAARNLKDEDTRSCSQPGARTQDVDSRSKQDPALLAIALAIQAPVDVLPALKRVTRSKLAAAIAASDDEAAERLRVRLDRLLNGEAQR
jgi:hypothetical protein